MMPRPLLSLLLCLLLLSNPATAAVIHAVTTEFPPFQSEQPAPWGLALGAAQALAARNGDTLNVQFLPWPRAYQMAETTPGLLIFCLGRTPQRETRYGWIGRIASGDARLWRLADRPEVNPATLQQAQRWQLGVTARDMKVDYLLQQGFAYERNLQQSSDDLSNIRKLYAGRIDLLPFSNHLVLAWRTRELGLDPRLLRPVLPLPALSTPLYLAFSPGSAPQLSRRYASLFRQLQREGVFDRLRQRLQLPRETLPGD